MGLPFHVKAAVALDAPAVGAAGKEGRKAHPPKPRRRPLGRRPARHSAVDESQLLIRETVIVKTTASSDRLPADYMSERTISNHLQHVFAKLQITSAVEAVAKAIQMGYIPPMV